MQRERIEGYHVADISIDSPDKIDPAKFSVHTNGGRGLFLYPRGAEVIERKAGRLHYVEAEGMVFDLTDQRDAATFLDERSDAIERLVQERGISETEAVSEAGQGEFFDRFAEKYGADIMRLKENVLIIKNIGCITYMYPL